MSKKLLLADDSVVIQKLVGLSFANEDIEIISTDNGDDAVALARDLRPDVVLADVVMPGKSGYEVCEAVRQDPAIAHVPVLLLTGTFEAFDEGRAASAGANGQITKPFEAHALVERVTEVMNSAPPIPAAPVIEEATPATPPPIPTLPPENETAAVTALGSTPASSDLFDSNVGQLAETSEAAVPDPTPSAADSGSDLFGAPGDGAADELDTLGGSLAIGQSASAADTPVSDPVTFEEIPSLPPLHESSPAETTALGRDDASERLDPLPAARPVDLDAALDAVPSEDDATILVAQDDVNATTSPDFGASSFARTGSDIDPFEDRTIHTPTSDIDQSASIAPTPAFVADLTPDERAADYATPPDATQVADLDAALDASTLDAATSEAEATVVQYGRGSDPLGLAPTDHSGDNVDFAFDVSEQRDAAPDPAEDSFSSLMDLSESQILASAAPPVREMPDATPTATAETATHTPDEATDEATDTDTAIGAGFDVSASDLVTSPPYATEATEAATDETDTSESRGPIDASAGKDVTDTTGRAPHGGSPTGTIVPEPEPLIEVPELPEARTPSAMDADLFAPLATGSALEELDALPSVDAEDTFSAMRGLDRTEDLLDPDLSHDFGTSLHAAPETTEEVLPETEPASIAFGAPSSEPRFDDAPPVVSADAADEGRRIPDLSPMMEQRIQETLEKVAWEAFSDLSESIVKQVMDRVEKIAWEVVPQMAETLVREEIRQMKGEDED